MRAARRALPLCQPAQATHPLAFHSGPWHAAHLKFCPLTMRTGGRLFAPLGALHARAPCNCLQSYLCVITCLLPVPHAKARLLPPGQPRANGTAPSRPLASHLPRRPLCVSSITRGPRTSRRLGPGRRPQKHSGPSETQRMPKHHVTSIRVPMKGTKVRRGPRIHGAERTQLQRCTALLAAQKAGTRRVAAVDREPLRQ